MTIEDCSNFLYIPVNEKIGNLRYIVDNEGHSLYLIKKSGLPKKIREVLVGGDAGKKKYIDYANLIDVYGLTSDLRVYYCSNGLDSILGLEKDDLDMDNPTREVFGKEDTMSKLLSGYDIDSDGTINAEELKSVTELSLDTDSNINNLVDLYNFPSLKEIILDNINLFSLQGIENCPKLESLQFKNYSNGGTIGDYSSMSKTTEVTKLNLENSTQNQLDSMIDGIGKGNLTKLNELKVTRCNNNITNIDRLTNLSKATKEAIIILNLSSNNISSISSLIDFINVTILNVNGNASLTSLKGVDKMTNLREVYAGTCNLGSDEIFDTELPNNGKNEEEDSLSFLRGKTKLSYLDVGNNRNLIWIDYILDSSKLTSLYLSQCDNLAIESVRLIVDLYNSILDISRKSISSKYASLFNTEEKIDYINKNLDIKSNEIQMLYGNQKVLALRLDGNINLIDTRIEGYYTLSEILETLVNLKVLSIRGINCLTNINFIENMPNLEELDLLNCENITDISILEKNNIKLKSLRMNNEKIDLTSIQTVISSLSLNSSYTFQPASFYYCGFFTDKESVMQKLSECINITNLFIASRDNQINDWTVDLTKCMKLLNIYCSYSSINFKCPSSLESFSCLGTALKSTWDLSKCIELKEATLDFRLGES